jgi:ABC-2 type transport system ATP-binding protein
VNESETSPSNAAVATPQSQGIATQPAPTTPQSAVLDYSVRPPLLQVLDYHKTYGDFVAVDGLTFEARGGEIIGLLGPNGAGKTTTMRAIAGIIPPTSGILAVAGWDVVQKPVAAKKELAYVPDDPRLFETLTVWEHLQFIASAYDVSKWQDDAEYLLGRFEMTDKRNSLAQELSRGMRQKLAICCAYLHRPKVILLDEPLTGLDPRGIRTMKQSLREQAQAGNAVVISSHLLSLVEDLCTHLLIVNKGRRLFFGRTDEARAAFADVQGDLSLEEVFFRATEQPAKPDVRP